MPFTTAILQVLAEAARLGAMEQGQEQSEGWGQGHDQVQVKGQD